MRGFQPEIAARILEKVSLGSNLEQICKEADFPAKPTVFKWLREQPDFMNEYARARELRAERRAERIDEYCAQVLAGELDANAARVIIDAEKWQAGKENPRVYGDVPPPSPDAGRTVQLVVVQAGAEQIESGEGKVLDITHYVRK